MIVVIVRAVESCWVHFSRKTIALTHVFCPSCGGQLRGVEKDQYRKQKLQSPTLKLQSRSWQESMCLEINERVESVDSHRKGETKVARTPTKSRITIESDCTDMMRVSIDPHKYHGCDIDLLRVKNAQIGSLTGTPVTSNYLG
jgi:ribosomal protein L34E